MIVMKTVTSDDIKKLYLPPKDSHKGQNGRLLIIGGSRLFHAASLWSLKVASRIVDMVYYSSVPENNQIVLELKKEFRDGIVVPRGKVDDYIKEADCILIGPGLPRSEGQEAGDNDTKELTTRLLTSYKTKQWVIDGGSLQVISPDIIPRSAIVTPHQKEFERLFKKEGNEKKAGEMAQSYNCIILLKGSTDYVCSKERCLAVTGGNPGMTKGGTGDVLAGLVAALACKNEPFLAASVGSFINKKAGDALYKRVGPYFNASDLADQIPKTMYKLFL